MYKLKNLLIAVVVLLISVSVLAAQAPLAGREQGESQNAPRHRGLRRFYLTQTQHMAARP